MTYELFVLVRQFGTWQVFQTVKVIVFKLVRIPGEEQGWVGSTVSGAIPRLVCRRADASLSNKYRPV